MSQEETLLLSIIERKVLPVVVLDLDVVPLSIRHSSGDVHSDLSRVRASVAPGREHKFDSFILNGQGDKIMLAVVSAIVQQ